MPDNTQELPQTLITCVSEPYLRISMIPQKKTDVRRTYVITVINVFPGRAAHPAELRTQPELSILNAFILTKTPLNSIS
jgi:hypothetical protein